MLQEFSPITQLQLLGNSNNVERKDFPIVVVGQRGSQAGQWADILGQGNGQQQGKGPGGGDGLFQEIQLTFTREMASAPWTRMAKMGSHGTRGTLKGRSKLGLFFRSCSREIFTRLKRSKKVSEAPLATS